VVAGWLVKIEAMTITVKIICLSQIIIWCIRTAICQIAKGATRRVAPCINNPKKLLI
jgi:hypothetical protein